MFNQQLMNMKIQLKYLQNRTSNIRQGYIRKRYREAINHHSFIAKNRNSASSKKENYSLTLGCSPADFSTAESCPHTFSQLASRR